MEQIQQGRTFLVMVNNSSFGVFVLRFTRSSTNNCLGREKLLLCSFQSAANWAEMHTLLFTRKT